MMNEELINELVRHKQEMQNDFGWNTTLQTALDAAIEALKAEPCEDAVSRTWIREHLGMFLRGCRAERTYEEIAEDVEAYIDYAPPVTPKQRLWI